MIPARAPARHAPGARLLVADAAGRLSERPRAAFVELLQPGDLLVANDAATLPASLHGERLSDRAPIEVRLAARRSLATDGVQDFDAVVFGAGDHRTLTERRPPPPPLAAGDRLRLGPLHATVLRVLGHPRLLRLRLEAEAGAVWAALARHGKPVQYAHMPQPLALWDVWTAIAALPVAFETPSAGYVLDWAALARLRERGVGFATLTHAAGLSSTGDAALDARLPLDEPYRLPQATVNAIAGACSRGARVVALGTTVVRALEHAAARAARRGSHVPPAGDGLADQRLGAGTPLRVVSALLTGTHEPGTSHHALLRAFVSDDTLHAIDARLESGAYRAHEFGEHLWVDADRRLQPKRAAAIGGRFGDTVCWPSPATASA